MRAIPTSASRVHGWPSAARAALCSGLWAGHAARRLLSVSHQSSPEKSGICTAKKNWPPRGRNRKLQARHSGSQASREVTQQTGSGHVRQQNLARESKTTIKAFGGSGESSSSSSPPPPVSLFVTVWASTINQTQFWGPRRRRDDQALCFRHGASRS